MIVVYPFVMLSCAVSYCLVRSFVMLSGVKYSVILSGVLFCDVALRRDTPQISVKDLFEICLFESIITQYTVLDI